MFENRFLEGIEFLSFVILDGKVGWSFVID